MSHLVVVLALRRRSPSDGAAEAALRASDLPLLAAATLCGAILGPSLMMFGLQRVSAITGSLLLNLEPPLTIFLAIAWFREHLGMRQVGAAALILAGTVLVGYRPGELVSQWPGIVAVAFACLAWPNQVKASCGYYVIIGRPSAQTAAEQARMRQEQMPIEHRECPFHQENRRNARR